MPQRLSDVPMADLVPETRDWNNGLGIDLESWIGCTGGFEQAIGYGELFWPEFLEMDGCVFFAGVAKRRITATGCNIRVGTSGRSRRF